jgi:ABC-type transport system involved in multi-copper enzyme maturation permease subunit
MNLSNIILIFRNTIYKEYRSKTLIFLLVLTLGLLLLFNGIIGFLGDKVTTAMGTEQVAQYSLTAFFAVINVWIFFLATFFGVNIVRSDLESQVAPQLLSFPIRRREYLAGRIFGGWAIVMGFYILVMFLAILSFSFSSGVVLTSWRIPVALLTTSIPTLSVMTIAVLISSNMGKLQSFITTMVLCLSIQGANSYFLQNDFKEVLSSFSIWGVFAGFLHSFFPHLGRQGEITTNILLGQEFKVSLGVEVSHFIVSYALLVFLLVWLFRKKEI